MDNREIKIINIDDVLPNRFQPRIQFDEKAINELAESIKEHGVIQPIVVRKVSDKYEIIAGERRYKASVLAGKTTIPAIITDLDDKESAEIALIENIQRQNLTPIEEAISYKKILDMGYLTQITLGEKLGKTQSTIANKLRLLNLSEEVQEALMENKISERHARSLLRLSSDKQIIMLNKIISERLTVRAADEEIEKMLNSSDDSEKEIERVENMNNDILKEMGIPTEPIIEKTVEEPMEEETMFEDIKTETPSLENLTFDVPSFDSTSVEEAIPFKEVRSSLEPEPFKEINPGFMDVEKIEKEAEDVYKAPEPIADIDALMDTSKNPEIVQPVSPMQEVPVQEETAPSGVPGGKFFTMFAREEDKNPDFVKDLESKEVNMDFEEPKVEETFTFTPSPITPIEEKEETVDPNKVFSMSQEVPKEESKPLDFTQTFTPFSLTDEETFTKEELKTEPVSTYKAPEPVTFDEMGEIEVKLPDRQKLATADLKTVINTIRECAATIERFGFTIDTEEIDFEDFYQVTFKIDKL